MYQQQQQYGYSPYGNSFGSAYGGSGFGNGFYGGGMGGFGMNSFGMNSFSRPGFGSGSNPLDPETRLIQMAEESSRSAFQGIESVVSTIGNIATMLDSTYFAMTSAFRAILGLAANFSQMRGFFTRFFSTFTIFRSFVWLYKKLLYSVGLSRVNPTTQVNLNEAFKDAEKIQTSEFFNASQQQQTSSGLPMVLFLAFVFTAPYLIMKLFGSLMNSAADQCKKVVTLISRMLTATSSLILSSQHAIHQIGQMQLTRWSCTTSQVIIHQSWPFKLARESKSLRGRCSKRIVC